VTRRVEIIPLESGYVVKGWAQTEAEAFALQSALVAVPPARAFTPGLARGEAFDAPERASGFAEHATNGRPVEAGESLQFYAPPNCGLPPSGYAEDAGTALALAQHEAACDGDECTGAACLLTRGSD
jgi:hypothetical protein